MQKSYAANTYKPKSKGKYAFGIGFYRKNTELEDRTTSNRDYGLKSTKGSATPYPQRQQKLDHSMLTAKLESNSLNRSELSETSLCISDKTHFSEPQGESIASSEATFEMRRKLFDEGEFTICKGRKMSLEFHHTDEDQGHLFNQHQKANDNFPCSNYMDLKNFCVQNNIKLL
ncbi:uncharacterized protein LOC6553826 [Drosophila erecta]|uniref:GG18388 n=1 Tax=Drosophila erecta TaxID=7220 RepID=B3P4G4_DROER|nr:uncharacterized protein LOC6553826 [Drosophila erecta]EDV49479.1 uncharacterized protein Dere_GG18388 [Drosophila erecta]